MDDRNQLVRICTDRQVIGTSDKAVQIMFGTTLDKRPITTWLPKSACKIKPLAEGGYEVWAPKWMNHERKCYIGEVGEEFPAAMIPATKFFS